LKQKVVEMLYLKETVFETVVAEVFVSAFHQSC